ncbi:MAG TPA: hypothetical protein IAC62_15610 [Candidatus Pelethocola excrementipullorum]|nr:hypothetical protein [Candidatus Pelethocola excrementipullorum]
MARPKNYAKLIELTQKKISNNQSKIEVLSEELQKLEEEAAVLEDELKSIKLSQLQQLMDERGLTVEDMSSILEKQL